MTLNKWEFLSQLFVVETIFYLFFHDKMIINFIYIYTEKSAYLNTNAVETNIKSNKLYNGKLGYDSFMWDSFIGPGINRTKWG